MLRSFAELTQRLRVLKMSRILINEQLYIQEDLNIFNPTPLIPLPSVSFHILSLRAPMGEPHRGEAIF